METRYYPQKTCPYEPTLLVIALLEIFPELTQMRLDHPPTVMIAKETE